MKKVSDSPFYLRNVFPLLWCGGCIYASMMIFGHPKLSNEGGYFFIATALMGSIISRWLALKLMDEVFDEGDSLLIRRNSKEQQIYLNQIIKVSAYSVWISLNTTSDGELGKKIYFLPKSRGLFEFGKHPYFKELNKRVESAKDT